MGGDLDVKITDYENKISDNQIQIRVYEEQMSELNECMKEINNQISYVEEDYPNNNKFKFYAMFDSLWYGENRNRYLDDIDTAYSSGIISFINRLERTNGNIKAEIFSISNKIEELEYENYYYNILKGNLELEKSVKNFIEEIV